MKHLSKVLVGAAVIGAALFLAGCAKAPSILSCNVTPTTTVIQIIKANNQYILSGSGVCLCDEAIFENKTGDRVTITLKASGFPPVSATLDPNQTYGPIPNHYREVMQAMIEIFGSAGKFQRSISLRCTAS